MAITPTNTSTQATKRRSPVEHICDDCGAVLTPFDVFAEARAAQIGARADMTDDEYREWVEKTNAFQREYPCHDPYAGDIDGPG